MNRLRVALSAILVSLFVAAAEPASAAAPSKETDAISFSSRYPAGTVCDFPLRDTIDLTITVVTFTDASGDVVKEVEHGTGAITHTNLSTGYTLSEVAPLNSIRWLDSGTASTMGVQWHLRDPSGRNVLTVAGRVSYSLDPFEFISITPRVEQFIDYTETICPLLGGSPA